MRIWRLWCSAAQQPSDRVLWARSDGTTSRRLSESCDDAYLQLEDDANLVEQKLRNLAAVVWLGLLAVLGGAAGALPGLNLTGPLQFLMGIGGTALSLLVDSLLFLSAYRILAAGKGPPWRDLWPGALASGVGWTLFKVAGSSLLARQVASARPVYGSLASVVAVLLYFYLVAQLYVYGAEFNALRTERNQDRQG